MDLTEQYLSAFDYIILICLLIFSMCIGVYYAYRQRKNNTIVNYLLADRKMHFLTIAMSAFATAISPISFVGTPVEIYVYGTQFWMSNIPTLLFLPFYANVLIPIYMNLNSCSLYTYYQRRYNNLLWKFCAISGILDMTMVISIVVFAASNVFSQITGIHIWTAAILVVSLCVIYTAIGGMKVVIWTDFLQGIIILITLGIILVLGTMKAGGLVNIFDKSIEGERLEFFDFRFDMTLRHTFWSATLGNFLATLIFRLGNQACVQRFFTAPNLKSAQRAAILGVSIQMVAFTCLCYIGVLMYVTYSNCDPITSTGLSQNKMSPLFMLEILKNYNGLLGLFLTALTAALLSTVSSTLSGLSTVTLQDLSCSRITNMTESKKIVYCQALVFFYGSISLLGIFMVQMFSNVFQAIMFLQSVVSTSSFTLILIGTFLPQVNVKAATIAEFSGILFGLWLAVGNILYGKVPLTKPMNINGCNATSMWTKSDNLNSESFSLMNSTVFQDGYHEDENNFWGFDVYNISFNWYSFLTALFVTTVCYILTICLGPERNSQYRDMVPPAVQKLQRSLPKRLRKLFLCDIYDEMEDKQNCELTELKNPKELVF